MIHRTAHSRRTRPHHAGFSLLELVIVVAIIGILSAMAVPRYVAALNRYRAAALAQRIVSDIDLVAAEARAASASRWVWFIPNQWYLSFNLPDPDRGGNYYMVQTTLEPYNAYIQSASFSGSQQVIFDGYGKPNSGGTIVVQSGDATSTVVLDANTGKATIQ